ncbi:unnamed protein product [Rhodiola kirilowii]
MDMNVAGGKRLMHLNELDEIRLDSYENARICKERMKNCHDKRIVRKEPMKESEFFSTSPALVYFLGSCAPSGVVHTQWRERIQTARGA